jgi:hypothetical protein
MPRQRASTLATGGSGYTFADKVAGALLAQALKRNLPFDSALGAIVEVHFETRDSNQILDDLRLILRRGSTETRCAVSVKSAAQLGLRGFSKEFVSDAWEHTQQAGFDYSSDLLVLVVGAINDRALQEWRKLESQASETTPERLVERLGTQQTSAIQKRMFESLRGLTGAKRGPIDTARLAARIRVVYFSDEQVRTAVGLCAELVRGGTEAEGTKLWDRLQRLSSDSRGPGAFFDIAKLLRELRPDFELRNFPDLEADWSRLDELARDNTNAVRSVIGTDRRIDREDAIAALSEACEATSVVAVVGESGSGKSAAVAQFVSGAGRFDRMIWLTTEQLSRGSQAEVMVALGLRYSVPHLIGLATVKKCVLVLDGFEDFQGAAHRRAIELIEALRGEGFVGWKVIVTCQTHGWSKPTMLSPARVSQTFGA